MMDVRSRLQLHMDYHLGEYSPDPISQRAFDRMVEFMETTIKDMDMTNIMLQADLNESIRVRDLLRDKWTEWKANQRLIGRK